MPKYSTGTCGSALFFALALALAACSKSTTPPGTPPAPAAPASAPAAAQKQASEVDRMKELVAQAPNFANVLNLGIAQLNAVDNEGAAQSFEQAIRLEPKNALGYNNLCVARNNQGRWVTAIEACQRAISLAPDMKLAKGNLAFAHAQMKSVNDRISALETKLKATPTDPNLLLALGFEHYNVGDYSKAATVWRRIQKGSKLWATAQNNIASASIVTKDWPSAKQAIENALAAEPANTLFLNNWAWYQRASKSGNP